MAILKAANLGIRFLLELCVLGALAYWGWQTGERYYESLALSFTAPLIAAATWGIFISPKARVPVSTPVWLGLQVVVFGAAVAALFATGLAAPGIALGVAAIINTALVLAWGQ